MKYLFVLIGFVLFSGFAPEEAVPFTITPVMIIGFVLGLIELIARLIPSVGQWGPLGIIINVLKWLSDYFNRKK